MVLWIGYLQWHFRTRGQVMLPQPVLKDFQHIECRDTVLAYDRVEYVTDERGVPVTRWNGKSMKKHPVTGEDVPVKPQRDATGQTKDGAGYSRYCWLHGKPRTELRPVLVALSRYVATVDTGKRGGPKHLDRFSEPGDRPVSQP